MDNAEYGTIRTHQERQYPERVSGTQLKNPNFAKMADAFGGKGFLVETNDQLPEAIKNAVETVEGGQFALIHLMVPQRHKAY